MLLIPPDSRSRPIKNGHANPKQGESLGEKTALLQDGHRILEVDEGLVRAEINRFFYEEDIEEVAEGCRKVCSCLVLINIALILHTG